MRRNADVPTPAAGRVRIIGGRWRGTKLDVPDAPGLRPTSDRVRETLFNWLQSHVPGARCLDLFAGSGALGLEAASRGAAQCVLVERDATLARGLRAVASRLRADSVQVIDADALAWLRSTPPSAFDIVFVDPPFAAGLHGAVCELLAPWLAPEAWIYVESPREADIAVPADWRLHREGNTREVRYALHRRPSGAPATLRRLSDAPSITPE